jgi:hypothetical protein
MVDQLLTNKGLQHTNAAVRLKALNCLRRVGLNAVRITTLSKLNLEDDSPKVRKQAGKVLAARMEHLSGADMKDVSALLNMTGKPEAFQIGLKAAKRLGPIAKEVLPVVLNRMQTVEKRDKLELALVLAAIDAEDIAVAKAASPILVAALRPEHQYENPSDAVLNAIAAIGQPVVGDIFKALEAADDIGAINANNRKSLFIALQLLGPKAYSEGNAQALRRFWKKERYRDVQEEAGRAVHEMVPPSQR